DALDLAGAAESASRIENEYERQRAQGAVDVAMVMSGRPFKSRNLLRYSQPYWTYDDDIPTESAITDALAGRLGQSLVTVEKLAEPLGRTKALARIAAASRSNPPDPQARKFWS